MKRIGLAVFATACLCGADDAESARDLAAMQGDWTMVSSELNGESLDDERVKTGRATVTADRYVPTLEGRRSSFTIRVEASTDPRAIELTVSDGPDQGQVLKGIYRLVDDRLTLCHGLSPRDDRPVEFATGAETGHLLVVWRKTKPGHP